MIHLHTRCVSKIKWNDSCSYPDIVIRLLREQIENLEVWFSEDQSEIEISNIPNLKKFIKEELPKHKELTHEQKKEIRLFLINCAKNSEKTDGTAYIDVW